MVSLKVNIHKKDLWLLSAVVVFLVGVGFVIAYNAGFSGGTPSVMGHSSDEVWVNFNGTQMNLQSALNMLAGGGGGGGSLAFGAWQNVTAAASTGNPQGPATSDGFVQAYSYSLAYLQGFTDSNSNPQTIRAESQDNAVSHGITMPVKKGDYWKLSGAVSKAYWLPIVSGGSSGLDLTNCAWTSWDYCTAWQTGNQLTCPSGKIVAGIQKEGCTSSSPPTTCDDSARCSHQRIYCCG